MWASVLTLRARKRLLSLEVGADCQRRLSSLLWSQGFLDSTSATPSTAFPSSVLAVEVQPIWRLDAAELHLERLLSLPSPKESVRPQPHTRCVNGREVGLAAPLVCLPLIALLYPTEPLQRAPTVNVLDRLGFQDRYSTLQWPQQPTFPLQYQRRRDFEVAKQFLDLRAPLSVVRMPGGP